MAEPLRIGITWEFLTEGAGLLDDVLPAVFGGYKGVEWEYMPQGNSRVIQPSEIGRYDALIALHHVQIKPESFEGVDRLACIARWGVGYDLIDVPACTANDVALCITPDAVRRPVAEGVIGMILALSKHLLVKDRLTREGGWDKKTQYVGTCLADRVLGCVGMGNIGAEVVRLLQPFGMARTLVYDPYLSPEKAAAAGVELADLDTVLRESDFVSIHCPLTKDTFHLLGKRELGLMKRTAHLINCARGPIVDQVALTEALQSGQIAGAGLDVYEKEPIAPDDPLLGMENVIATPHGIVWTEELFRDNGLISCRNILAILRGDEPQNVVNRQVVSQPGFQAKLRNLRDKWYTFNG